VSEVGSPADLRAWLDHSRAWVEAEMERLVPPADAPPTRLHEALRYALFGGGKRLRPALVRMLCEALGGTRDAAARPAVAVELIHTYSLVHDDLPCMDDDDLRRGRPTCHVVFGEALAVLAGDALQTCAFEVLAGGDPATAAECVAVLAGAAGSRGMVGGQVLDLFEDGDRPARERVEAVHLLKTARLFAASAELGAIAAGADARRRERAHAFGRAVGLLFQATDDLLDVTGDARTLGKTPGKDAALQKPTLVAALGVDGARGEAERLGEDARAALAELGGGPGGLPAALVDFVLARSA